MTDDKQRVSAGSICFGLNREIDEASLKALCVRFSREDLLAALLPRLSDDELLELADSLFSPMKKHLSKQEYHTLFLDEQTFEDK